MATNVPTLNEYSIYEPHSNDTDTYYDSDFSEDISEEETKKCLKSKINPESTYHNINHNTTIRTNNYKNKPSTNYIRLKNLIIKYKSQIIIVLTICASILLYVYIVDVNSNNPAITTLNPTLERINNQFPSLNKKFLKKVKGGLLRLKEPGEPFVFMLLHDDSNKKATDCLASYTSSIAKKNIFTKTIKSLWMNASEWVSYSSSSDLDLLHNKLIKALEENEVLILENLQDLPWTLAKYFHHLCDTVNPKFVRAMYLLELKVNVDKIEELNDVEKIVAAEKAMEMAWLDAPRSFRAALIARLTSYVDTVLLKSDEECPNSVIQQSDRPFISISP